MALTECDRAQLLSGGDATSHTRAVHVTGRDAALAERIQQRDEEALEILMRELGGAVKSVAVRVLRDDVLAEDVLQETFMGFWDSPERFDPARGSLRTFLSTIAHRKAVDSVRSEVARSRRELTPPEPAHFDLEDEVWARSLSESVRAALDQLPEGEREAIALAYFGGLSYMEVAKRLGAPEGTVKSRIRSGMKKLSVALATVSS